MNIVLRIMAAIMLLIVVTPWLASTELGGLAAPAAVLSLWIVLAKHRLISETWRIKDDELLEWLDSESPAAGNSRNLP